MPLANLLAPQIARKAEELRRQLPPPQGTGYLQPAPPRLPMKEQIDADVKFNLDKYGTRTPQGGAGTAEKFYRDRATQFHLQGRGVGRAVGKAAKPAASANKAAGYLPSANKAAPAMVQDASPVDRMPVFSKADSLGRQTHASNIAAMVERGQPVPPAMYQGLSPDEIAQAHALGSEMRAYGGDPTLTPVPAPADKSAVMSDGVYRGEAPVLAMKGYESPDAQREHGQKVDAFVQKHGYLPQMFADKTSKEAFDIIARQLQARREAMGDPTAWMMGPSA